MKTAPRMPDSVQHSVTRDEVLSLAELARRFNWGAHAIRQAKRCGLKTIAFGRQRFVLGEDILDFFSKLAREQDGHGEGEGGQSRG